MSIHEKMSSDYLWVRNAPVEEGAKVKYNHSHEGITASISFMTALPIRLKDLKAFIGSHTLMQIDWKNL